MEYTYSASGEKLEKLRKSSLTNTYIGNFVYKGDGSLDYIITPEGRLVNVSGNLVYEYYLKDHLGNTRNTFQIVSNTVVQKQKMDYYPFGMQLDKAFASHDNKYLYNGKELQDDQFDNGMKLDWLDYGARFYDAVIGRWHVIDNKAEKYYSTNPYTYCLNNPIIFIDPDGNEVWKSTKDNGIYEEQTEEGVGRTGAHEVGHTGNLRHPSHSSNNLEGVDTDGNLMHQTSNDKKGTNLKSVQLDEFSKHVQEGKPEYKKKN